MKGRKTILNNKEEQIYKKQEKLHIYEYENAIILPRKFEENAPTWGKGGVCDQDDEFVQSSFYDGGWAQNGGRKMKPMWMKKSFTSEFLQNIGDTSLLI